MAGARTSVWLLLACCYTAPLLTTLLKALPATSTEAENCYLCLWLL